MRGEAGENTVSQPGEEIVSHVPRKTRLRMKRARVPGYCNLCNSPYRAGTLLTPDGQGRWVHKTCMADGTTHYLGPLVVTEPYAKCTCGGWLYEGRSHTCEGGV